MEFTPENINKPSDLPENGVFVFGSNLMGRHGAGAAKTAAKHFGAVHGIGIGHLGQSYAIPTKGYVLTSRLSVEEIRPYVQKFIAYAKDNKHLKFYVTQIGCGLAGHDPKEISQLFKKIKGLDNVVLPENFAKFIT